MFNQTIMYIVVIGLIFCSVALASYGIAQHFVRNARIRQRFQPVGSPTSSATSPAGIARKIEASIGPDRTGVTSDEQKKLRGDLIRAGFFAPDAVVYYTLARLALVVIVPLGGVLAISSEFAQWDALFKFLFVAGAFLLAYYLPRAFLDRRHRMMTDHYRLVFPDFLDLLVVCVDAGLSLEASLERVSVELRDTEPKLQANLGIMSGEMRAGRGTTDALHGFAERLGLDEARSLTMLLQQSLELGTDIAQALATYAEEMRDKRTARAEEKAYALPVKLVLPLGLFIFPVIMIVILTPVVIRLIGLGNHF
jgi:tight adherence protein C